MSRAVTVLVATAAALGLLFAYRPATRNLAVPGPAPSATPSPTPSPSAVAANPSPASTPVPTLTPTPHGANGTFTGADVANPYGDVQVRITVVNGRVTDVKALTLPSDRARSELISQYAGPQLRTEAIQAQSAQIDIVSGATFTSEGYAQSLSDALHKAGLGGG
jgi:uncharacterized protein with FMN-binding domain